MANSFSLVGSRVDLLYLTVSTFQDCQESSEILLASQDVLQGMAFRGRWHLSFFGKARGGQVNGDGPIARKPRPSSGNAPPQSGPYQQEGLTTLAFLATITSPEKAESSSDSSGMPSMMHYLLVKGFSRKQELWLLAEDNGRVIMKKRRL